MRFHMGISFRLKTLKRFLLPFLIGVLAYFGISSFNIMQVHAYNSNSSYYEFQYDEIDFSNIQTNGDYTFKDILDITQIPSDYYFIYSVIIRDYNSNTQSMQYGLKIYLIPKENQFINGQFYGFINSNNNNSIDMYHSFNNINNQRVYYYTTLGSSINTSYSTQDFNNIYRALSDCLTSNNCSSGLLAYSNDTTNFYLDSFTGSISNTSSYTINYKNLLSDNFIYERRFMPYYKNIKIQYYNNVSTTPTYIYKKLIKINSEVVSNLADMPTYCDYYNCEASQPPTWMDNVINNPTFNIGGISPSDFSNLNIELHYQLISGSYDTNNPFQYLYNIYGRIDHGTYYSYEKIDCSLSQQWGISTDYMYNYYVNSTSCVSDLSSYDYIYIDAYPYNNSFTANNITITTNYGYSNISSLEHHYQIFEKFNNLPSDFNILLSTNDDITSAYFSSDNDYVLSALVNRNTNKISSLVANKYQQFGSFDNTSLMIYNLKSANNYTTNELNIFFQVNTILSVGDNGSFSYYDSSNTIINGNIENNYQAYTDETYNLNYYFNQVNDFLDDLDADLLSVHDIFQNIFNSIPYFFQVCITIFYILLLTFLLFRFIRS